MTAIPAHSRFNKIENLGGRLTNLPPTPVDPNIIDSAALERLEEWGGPGLSNEIVRLFLEHGPSRLEQIRGAAEGEDLDVPERGAHSLKSSAANVGARHVQEIASQLELAAGEGDLQGFLRLVPDLDKAYADAARELAGLVEEGVK